MKKFFAFLFAVITCTAFAHTIEWYVDGSVYDTTTCSSGDNITPPTAPAKYGYHLVEWKRSEYTELEYIESTGTQYIDTGVTGVCELTMIAQGTNSQPLRSEIVAGSAHENSASWIGVFSSQTNWQRSNVPFTTKVNILFQFKEPPSIYTIDNQTYETSSGSYYDTRPIKLFGIDLYMAHVRIFKATFTQNGITVRNFIPVKQISDNAIGMYDTISNTFFTNKGTGEFIAGPEIGDL